jgi:hypothetical protein
MTDYQRYADFYRGLPYRPDAQWALILTDDPATIKTLTGILKMSQTEAVDDFLEESCWSNSFPELVGHKGTAAQRLAALRGAYQKEIAERRKTEGYIDYDLLTPLEHELYKVVLSVKISGCAEKAATLDKDIKRALKAAQDHAINLTGLAAKEGEG